MICAQFSGLKTAEKLRDGFSGARAREKERKIEYFGTTEQLAEK
jgi:hypothetical protein